MSAIYLDNPPKPGYKEQVKATLVPSRSWLKEAFPVLQWLPKYNRQWAYGDLICGLTVAIVVIPQSMAYAQMAGLPPQYGLYSSVIGLFIYPWLGTSKDISIGTTAINSLLFGQITAILVATPEFQNGTWSFFHITSNLSLITGIIVLAIGILRLGILFDFICQPAIGGFMAGTAITIVISQLYKVFGLSHIKTTDPTYLILGNTLKHLPESQWDAAIGILGLAFLYGAKYGAKMLTRRYPKYSKQFGFFSLCRNIIVIVGATLLSFLIIHFGHFPESPFKILGEVPAGFQNMGAPKFDPSLLSQILPNLVGVVVLQIMEHCSVATSLGKVADYKIQVNQEITSIGLSNIFGSFFGAYTMTGSFCRSAVMAKSGVRTPLANLLVGAVVVLTIYCFTPALQYIPEASIGAIVIHAVTDLITGPKVWAKFWNMNHTDMAIFAAAYVLPLFTRIDISVYVPVALSIIIQLYRMSRPKYAFLGRLDTVGDQQKQPILPLTNTRNDNEKQQLQQQSQHLESTDPTPRTMFFSLTHPILKDRILPISPSIVCFQPRSDLVFENVNYLYGKLMDEIKKQTRRGVALSSNAGGRPWNDAGAGESYGTERPVLSSVILDLSGVHVMDYTAMEALAELTRMVDRYCGSPIPWYIVIGSSELVRHSLLYAGFGRQQRKIAKHGIFSFHNDLKKRKHKSNNKTVTTTSTRPTTSGKQVCPHVHDSKSSDDKKEHITTMTIEDVTDRHHTPTMTSPNTPSADSPALPDEDFEKAKSLSTVSSDQFDEYPPWCYCQEDDDDDDDNDDDDDSARNNDATCAGNGPITHVRDRYPYFFLSLHDAAAAALQNVDSSSSDTIPLDSVSIEMDNHR